MSSIGLTEDGVDDLVASLGRAGAAVDELAATNHDAGALVVLGATIPRLTGYLESTVTVSTDEGGVTVKAGAPYAVYVHARTPFLTDALDERESAVVDLYAAHLDDAVDLIQGA